LYSEGLKISTVDHIICWSIYFNDPDGNGLEIYLDTRDLPGRSHLWQGRDLPLEPGKILAALDYPDQN
jgi:catechol 2,3-dioxygenase